MARSVPLEDWQVGPWNRWAYVHVDELVPTARVARGDGPAVALPSAEGDLEDLAADLLATGWVDGLAVLHRGALVLERYGGEAGPASLHLSQSVGKSVLGLLVGALVGQGRLDPDDPVTAHVPEVRGSGYDGARVSHLLDMTAAVAFTEDYAVDFWRYDVACAWCPRARARRRAPCLEFLPGIGRAPHEHGERMHYATPTTDLLGVVAERAGGAPLSDLLARELWTPLGAERDALLTVDAAGTATIGGGFCATLRDYVRLGALVLDGGRGVVPEGWVARLGVGDPEAYARCTVPERTAGAEGYALQWWRRDGRPMARGIHGQLIAVDPAAEAVVVILSSWPQATDDALEAAHRGLVDRVCRRLRELP